MTLNYAERIAEIENCPLENDPRDMMLYRLIKGDTTDDDDLKPKALNKRGPRFDKICEGWAISVYDNLDDVQMNYNGMTPELKERFAHISGIMVTPPIGIKYQSTKLKSHYSLFPFKDDEFVQKFNTVKKL